MAIDIKGILHAGTAAQSAALALDNVKLMKKKVTPKRLVRQGVTNIVGVSLIQAQSKIINDI